ncbi:hypothetical protein M514_09458 [Trichuris suis]|uniref:Uncharacterized protein n=1 Tax=Trichuris suis TaxID=68888 RepID=A0A085N9X9_9BILA|nr:hypothetical protein M513_09458 [Trichuris suis]KFD66275.1 hypothetical protein M514_09458 [Trichuris suis]
MEQAIQTSAVAQHATQCTGQLRAKVLCKERQFMIRKIKEALYIKFNLNINRDSGIAVLGSNFKQWQLIKTEESHKRYLEAKQLAKKEVSKTKAAHTEELYQKLGTPQGELLIYKLAKARSRAAKDIDHYYQIKDINGNVLRKPKEILDRWKCHFRSIATEEFKHPPIPTGTQVAGTIHEISTEEVKLALTKMKNGKATGADDLPSDFWKFCGPAGVTWLT